MEERPISQDAKTSKAHVSKIPSIGSGSRPREQTLSEDGGDRRPDKTKIKIMDPRVTKHALPGNSMIPAELEKATRARQNRYGVDGDNGYSDMA